MPVYRSDVPTNQAITREASIDIIPAKDFLEADEIVEKLKKQAATVGGAARLDLPNDLVANARHLAIWKATRMDSTEWPAFVNHLAQNKTRSAAISAMKRAVEDFFNVILDKSLAEQQARLESETRELMVDDYRGVHKLPDHTYEIRYSNGLRAKLLEIRNNLSSPETLTTLDSLILDPTATEILIVQKFLGAMNVGEKTQIRYIPLRDQI